jgi:hypothetical protein
MCIAAALRSFIAIEAHMQVLIWAVFVAGALASRYFFGREGRLFWAGIARRTDMGVSIRRFRRTGSWRPIRFSPPMNPMSPFADLHESLISLTTA